MTDILIDIDYLDQISVLIPVAGIVPESIKLLSNIK